MSKTPGSTAFNETLDSSLGTPSAPSVTSRRGVPVELVEGSGPKLDGETRCLLQQRLRVSALVLFGGFGVFLIYRLIFGLDSATGSPWILGMQSGVTLLLGLMSVAMCRRCQPTALNLRVKEALIFGMPAVFFLIMNYRWIGVCAEKHDMIPSIAGAWYLLMFTYALFIPNTMRRAGIVLGCMAVAPIGLLVYMALSHAASQAVVAVSPEPLIVNSLLIAIGAVVGTVGNSTIGSLRREVFAAKQLGQYRLCRKIGAGGMGEVHLAEHQLLKRPCAIKLIRPEKAGDPKVLARFEREVRATAKLSHWNTIEIFDYGRTEDGTFYYVMEFLPGLSLSELVEQNGPLEPRRVVHLLRQVCEGLAEAHAAGLVHRDLKPGNIFAAQRGGVNDVAKVLDFGLVKPLADIEPDSTQLTQEGTITGSPLYMSPEQAMGKNDADERSDIYSLGGVAYYLLTGRPPFEGDRPLQVIIAHSTEQVVPPREIREDIPADLERIVLRCLEKMPSDRYQSVRELELALAACESADQWSRDDAQKWWAGRETTTVAEPVQATA